MSRRHRAVFGASLQTPEEALELGSPGEPVSAVDIAAARRAQPEGLHWYEPWSAGRHAALDAIESGADPRALVPPAHAACRHCWALGRDYAVEAAGQ